ncbi:hypothetical protein HAX54_024569 [Datura stramonium]|uniref:Ubiquitin-like protease family profile domain-containing protein n=1 Tax=Datura stramonium TaxID=4076 RepID=A0ABS8V0E9_DATST|nr:hypothetical protein [Datura stramonium]
MLEQCFRRLTSRSEQNLEVKKVVVQLWIKMHMPLHIAFLKLELMGDESLISTLVLQQASPNETKRLPGGWSPQFHLASRFKHASRKPLTKLGLVRRGFFSVVISTDRLRSLSWVVVLVSSHVSVHVAATSAGQPYSTIHVPQQRNEYDCGLFVLFFVERFIEEVHGRVKKKDFTMNICLKKSTNRYFWLNKALITKAHEVHSCKVGAVCDHIFIHWKLWNCSLDPL